MSNNKTAPHVALGLELKRLREAQGITTHTELAKLVGVAQQTVTRWEAGASRPQMGQIARIATVLRADPQRLLVAAGYVPEMANVSFDQPLPLLSLSPEAFQRFCRSLLDALYPGSKVHAAGKTGHRQFGTDIEVELDSGEVHSFQCKREAEFGAAKVKATVREHQVPAARKFILLSRVASPLARREIGKHAHWEIWDQDDLSEKLRILPVDIKRRLVDTYFPRQRFALLGESSPGPWLPPTDFFAPLVVADRPFSHHWDLVGRKQELSELSAALANPANIVISLIGPAGRGKSRILRSAVEASVKDSPGRLVLVLSPTEPLTVKSLDDLGNGPKLLVVDDAHDRTDLDPLFRYAATPQTNTQILLVLRPYAQEMIGRQHARYGLANKAVMLSRPTEADAVALATQVLESLGGPANAAAPLAEVAFDSPLSIVVGAWIIANEGVHPELFRSHDVFTSTVLSRYSEAIAKSVSHSLTDQDLVHRMLRAIALIQPIVPDDRNVLALYDSVERISVPDATRLTRLLITSGVLFKRGARYRLSPDLLADSLIESSCITQSGLSNGYAERLFDLAAPEHKAHLLLNLGRLDWRRHEGDTSGSRLLDGLWGRLKLDDGYAQADLKAAVEAAYYQPRQALDFARRLIFDGHINGDVCRLIRHAAYNITYLEEACVLLWNLGRSDARALNQHPYHPIRLLAEMATPEPRVPADYIRGVVDFAISLIPYDDSWSGAYTPFDVLNGALATEGHFTSKTTGNSITLTSYGVNLEIVKSMRDGILSAIFDSLTSTQAHRAYQAAKTLQNALRGPIGIMNRTPSDSEREGWLNEFTAILHRLASLIEQEPLSPVILVRVAESVEWHAHYSGGPSAQPANRILQHLDRDLATRVIRVLVDGWGHSTWRHELDGRDRNSETQLALAQDLEDAYPDAWALAAFVDERLLDLQRHGPEPQQSAHVFVHRLLRHSPALARVILDRYENSRQRPIAQFASEALATLIKHESDEAHRRIEALLARDDRELALVARSYASGLDGRTPLDQRDRLVLQRIFNSNDPEVCRSVPWIFRVVAESDRRFAIELLLNANPAMVAQAHHEIFMWLGDDQLIPLDSIGPDELVRILGYLESMPRLDDYHIHAFLTRVAKRAPRLVIDLAQTRILHAFHSDDWGLVPIGRDSDHHESLAVLEHTDGVALLRETLDWALQRIAEDRFAYHFSYLVSGVFGLQHPSCSAALETWCAVGTPEHFKVLACVLREAPPVFVFTERAFVTRILREARVLGMSVYRDLCSSLYLATTTGLRGGTVGQPFPEDLRTKEQSEEALLVLSKADPAYAFYESLRNRAARDIEWSLADGRAIAEEDLEE